METPRASGCKIIRMEGISVEKQNSEQHHEAMRKIRQLYLRMGKIFFILKFNRLCDCKYCTSISVSPSLLAAFHKEVLDECKKLPFVSDAEVCFSVFPELALRVLDG